MAAPTALEIERQPPGAKLVDGIKSQFARTLSGIDRGELAQRAQRHQVVFDQLLHI